MTAREWVRTAFIVVFLGMQGLAVLHGLGGGGETLWPFLPWRMFPQSYEPPVAASRHRIFAVTATGERRVRPEDAGLDRYAFRLHYRLPIAAGDTAAARDLAERVGRRWGTPVHRIAVEATRFTLEEEGFVETTATRRVDVR